MLCEGQGLWNNEVPWLRTEGISGVLQRGVKQGFGCMILVIPNTYRRTEVKGEEE
jgi:hypothetical protein